MGVGELIRVEAWHEASPRPGAEDALTLLASEYAPVDECIAENGQPFARHGRQNALHDLIDPGRVAAALGWELVRGEARRHEAQRRALRGSADGAQLLQLILEVQSVAAL